MQPELESREDIFICKNCRNMYFLFVKFNKKIMVKSNKGTLPAALENDHIFYKLI